MSQAVLERFRLVGFFYLSLSVMIWPLPYVALGGSSAVEVEFIWKGSDKMLLESQRDFLQAQGARIKTFDYEKPSVGMGPAGAAMLILAGSAAICVLAQSVTRAMHFQEKANGGVEFEFTKDKVKIYERPDKSNTELVIRKPDGTVIEYKTESDQNLCNILTSVLRPS